MIARLGVACALIVLVSAVSESQAVSFVAMHRAVPARDGVADSATTPAHGAQRDTYLGPDKVKHFLLSAFIESVGFSALQMGGASRGSSLAAATTVTVATGIGREIHDGRTKGLFSLGDLLWDAVGTGAALLLISHTQR